jgi:hypothetical protein
MAAIEVRLDSGELSPRLVLQTERSYGTILDIELAAHVTVNGSPDAYREFARDLIDLVDMVSPRPDVEYADLPVVNVVSHRFAPSFEQEQEAAGNDRFDQERDR